MLNGLGLELKLHTQPRPDSGH